LLCAVRFFKQHCKSVERSSAAAVAAGGLDWACLSDFSCWMFGVMLANLMLDVLFDSLLCFVVSFVFRTDS
jgi:hypothetical protein